MDRAEATGLGVATAGHLALLAALTFGLATTRLPVVKSDPIEVSFVEDVGLVSSAPTPSAAEPAPMLAPEEGPPEPAMPAPPQVQPIPQPQPVVRAPAPTPAPTPKPAPRAAVAKPAPAKPTPRAASPKAAPPKAAPAKAAPARAVPAKAAPAAKGNSARPTGRLSGLLNGVSDRTSESRSTARPAAVMNAQAAASIGGLIRRQVQPCADRMVNPGPGASRIKVRLNLQLNRNGSLRAPPSVEGVSGLDEENRRYAPRVKEMAVAAFTSCAPLQGLPPELYAVSNGWSDFDMNYNLP